MLLDDNEDSSLSRKDNVKLRYLTFPRQKKTRMTNYY